MLTLAIDTSGRKGSVALCRGDEHTFQTLQLTTLEGGTYSAQLIPTIGAILRQHHISTADLEGFAVVSGPGSFTGLRVGLATVKGLCEVLHKPLATISMLEALAIAHASGETTVTAVLDAGRGEVYVGEYKVSSGKAAPIREFITKLDQFAPPGEIKELLTPDIAVSDFLQMEGVNIRQVPPVRADAIGRIGIRKLLAGEVADHATVDVNYIRRSDAEIFSEPNH